MNPVKEVKAFGNGHYLVMDVPLVHTDILQVLNSPNNFAGNITFKITRGMSETLFQEVLALENKAANTLRALDDEKLMSLPDHIRTQIQQRREDPTWQCLRPNYFQSEELAENPTLFLKGITLNVAVFDFAGSYLPAQYLQSGQYQFVIRANMVYIGEHKHDYHIGNLQLRLAQVRFNPGAIFAPQPLLPIEQLLDDMEKGNTAGYPAAAAPEPTTPTVTAECPPSAAVKVAKKKRTLPNETPKKSVLKRQNAMNKTEAVEFLKETEKQ